MSWAVPAQVLRLDARVAQVGCQYCANSTSWCIRQVLTESCKGGVKLGGDRVHVRGTTLDPDERAGWLGGERRGAVVGVERLAQPGDLGQGLGGLPEPSIEIVGQGLARFDQRAELWGGRGGTHDHRSTSHRMPGETADRGRMARSPGATPVSGTQAVRESGVSV